MNSSSSNFRLITTAILSTGLLSCASYEFGESPLNQAEIDYFSKVDPAAATIRNLGGNTFDVTNPTLHASVALAELDSWPLTGIPFSRDRYLDIVLNAYDFPIGLAYDKAIAEKCNSIGLERGNKAKVPVGDFTIRYQCLDLVEWVSSNIERTINQCSNQSFDIKVSQHPCVGGQQSFSKKYCDSYTELTGFGIAERFSCRDLVNHFDQQKQKAQKLSIAEQATSQRENQCKEFGFVEGTPEMANCLLELYKIENQPQQNTVIANPAPSVNNAPNPAAGIELMNRGLRILNGAGTPSAPAVTTSSRCTRIGDVSGQVYTFNSPACPAGYAPAF